MFILVVYNRSIEQFAVFGQNLHVIIGIEKVRLMPGGTMAYSKIGGLGIFTVKMNQSDSGSNSTLAGHFFGKSTITSDHFTQFRRGFKGIARDVVF